MNNEPVALTQGDILGILQDANSVPCGQPIFNSSEEYNKLKAIIESAIRYTHPAKHLSLQKVNGELVAVTYTDDEHRIIEVLWEKPPAKTLTDEEIKQLIPTTDCYDYDLSQQDFVDFARAILRKAQKK